MDRGILDGRSIPSIILAADQLPKNQHGTSQCRDNMILFFSESTEETVPVA